MAIVNNKQTREIAKRSMFSFTRLQDAARNLQEATEVEEVLPLDVVSESMNAMMRRRRSTRGNTIKRTANVSQLNTFLESATNNLLAQVVYSAFPADESEKEHFRASIITEATALFNSEVCTHQNSNKMLRDIRSSIDTLREAFDPDAEEDSGFNEYAIAAINNMASDESSDLSRLLEASVIEIRERILDGVSQARQQAAAVQEALDLRVAAIDKGALSEDAAKLSLSKLKNSFQPSLMETFFGLVSKEHSTTLAEGAAVLSDEETKNRISSTSVLYMAILETASAFGLFGDDVDMNSFARQLAQRSK